MDDQVLATLAIALTGQAVYAALSGRNADDFLGTQTVDGILPTAKVYFSACIAQGPTGKFPRCQLAHTFIQHRIGIAAILHHRHLAVVLSAAQQGFVTLLQPQGRTHGTHGAGISRTETADNTALQVVVNIASISEETVVLRCQHRQIACWRRSTHIFQHLINR